MPYGSAVNLQQLRYLVATADHGTMTKAAQACHVAQPALTRAVRALERELGRTLFVREGRSVALTGHGRLVVDAARRVLVEVRAIEELGQARAAAASLTVAATPTIEADLGAGLISDLWASHPEVSVRFLHCESRQEVGDAVASERADAGITDLPVTEGLCAVPVETREVVLVAPPGTGLPDPLPVAALGDLQLILPTTGTLRRAAFGRMFAELGIAPAVAFESDERASWIPAVLARRGCCIWYRARGDLARSLGAEVSGLDPRLEVSIAVVHRRTTTPAVEALLEVAEHRAASTVHARDARDGDRIGMDRPEVDGPRPSKQ